MTDSKHELDAALVSAMTELTVVSRTNSDDSVSVLIAAGDRAKVQAEIDRVFRIAEDAGGTANAAGKFFTHA